MAPLSRLPEFFIHKNGMPLDDGFGNQIMCQVMLRFKDNTSVCLQRMYTPGIGAFTQDPSMSLDTAVQQSTSSMNNLNNLPANVKVWLFPENYKMLWPDEFPEDQSPVMPIAWNPLPCSPMDPILRAIGIVPGISNLPSYGLTQANLSPNVATMAQPLTTPKVEGSSAAVATVDKYGLGRGKGKAEDANELGEEREVAVITSPINFRILYTTMLNTPQLHELYTIPDTSLLSTTPGPSTLLPTGINLTTSEILAFFPGLLHDPYFIYRAYSTGWNWQTMVHAARMYRDVQWELSHAVVEPLIRRGMAYVLGLDEEDWSEDEYQQRVPVERRLKLHDYTRGGLSVTHSTHPASRSDLMLSQLRNEVKVLPINEDAGALTTLIAALNCGQIRDMPMSALGDFVETSVLYFPPHGPDEDLACAQRWREKLRNLPWNLYMP
ncbi:uncharacterized protein PV09_06363 [Verruconis gallopava]|uniref:Uncharacterized protein n=1 Tax=Verruconis gallopava TaxID=253628 RepID=A0A0D1YN80_9PEZI|nr:uncharacterized protein PV09_06363 [Verruconis gallopava]KIW02207.1 hypothetical protein PV09_06363 [Verruconis gallopava]